MKIFNKKVIKIAAIIFGGFFVLYLALIGPELWKSYKWQKALEKFEAEMKKPYEEDIYGGKTPEETWSMFLDALKKGDIDLASKYYDVEHQEKRKSDLQIAKNEHRLEEIIRKFSIHLEKQEGDFPRSDRAYYIIPFENKDNQIEAYPINFYLNPYTQIWKILY